jgi:hypothetical protein
MSDAIHAYLGYSFVPNLIGIASLDKEMSGNNTYVIHSKHCINKKMLDSGCNYIDHISDEALNTHEGKINLYRTSRRYISH